MVYDTMISKEGIKMVNELEAFLNEFDVLAGDMQLAGLLGIFLVAYFAIFAFAILCYVLESLGLYTIAKRRGLNNPWLAWIPVGNTWILGLIGDKDGEKRNGKDAKLRVWLLVLPLIVCGLAVVMMVLAFILGFNAAAMEVGGAGAAYESAENMAIGALLAVLVLYLLVILIAVALSVLQYVAYFRLFKSCNANNAALFLVLGIFFGFLLPFFVFASRKQDEPLPAPQYTAPVFPQQ